jgi:hypothetical protein
MDEKECGSRKKGGNGIEANCFVEKGERILLSSSMVERLAVFWQRTVGMLCGTAGELGEA